MSIVESFRILVFSDSHRRSTEMQHVIAGIGTKFDCIMHLGDCVSDAELMSRRFPDFRFEWVSGNCDYSSHPFERLVSLGGKQIFITHGHLYGVKLDYQRLVYAALEKQADACLFGHSHQPAVFYEQGCLFLNPGSVSLPRGVPYPSYGVLEGSDSGLSGNIVTIIKDSGASAF